MRARDDLDVRVQAFDDARGANVEFRVVGREHEDLGFLDAGCAQQLGPARITEIDVLVETAHEFDLFDRALQRGERDPLRAQHARDDLADAAVTGDDDARVFVRDDVELRLRFLLLPGKPLAAADHEQRGQRHRQGDRDDEQAVLARLEQLVVAGEVEHDEGELAAAGEHERELDRLLEVEFARELADREQRERLDRKDAGDDQTDHERLLLDQAEIERDADADEEQAKQQALERLDLRFDLVAEFRVGEQHAGEERAE